MKTGIGFLVALLALFGFTNCGNGKKLQEDAPLPIEQPFYTTWTGGVKTAGSGLNLYIPVNSTESREVELDSAYFRGRKAKLERSGEDVGSSHSDVYVAYFRTAEKQKAPELIMHRDPKKEFGNKPPEIIGDFPFELEDDEAVISYKKNGKTGYFKLSNIRRQKEDVDVKIKHPQGLQH